MTFAKFSLLCSLPMLALGASFKRATPDEFALYGYGEGFGGFTMFYSEGYAYLGEAGSSNGTDSAYVSFSPSGSGTSQSWIGNPNTTLTNYTVSWSDVALAVPSSSANDTRVKFVSSNTTDSTAITTGFFFYGSTALLIENGQLESSWSALRVSDRIHALYWNDTSLGQVPVTLRSTPPSNPTE